jgi:hypothetical protein
MDFKEFFCFGIGVDARRLDWLGVTATRYSLGPVAIHRVERYTEKGFEY